MSSKMNPYAELRGLTADEKSILASGDLERIGPELWEKLCDGCARCCLHKILDPAKAVIYQTMLACPYLDLETCLCSIYSDRRRLAPNCLVISPANLAGLDWLPSTCAYRRVLQGAPLPPWHYLITGSRQTVHRKGVSVKGFAISAKGIAVSDYPYYIIKVIDHHHLDSIFNF